MTDHYERFQNNVKAIKSEERARPKRRQDRLDDRKRPWDIGPILSDTEKFRDGWDRIFGAKTGESIPGQSAECAQGAGDLLHEDPASEPLR